MPSNFNTVLLGTFIRDKIKTNVATELGLATCNFGDLEQVHWPPSEDAQAYSELVPAVFVSPQSIDQDLQTLNQRYTQNNRFRIVYVDRIAESANHESNRIKVNRIADQIVDDYRFAAIAGLSRAQMQIAVIESIEYRPAEDLFVASACAQLLAAVITVNVRLIVSPL